MEDKIMLLTHSLLCGKKHPKMITTVEVRAGELILISN
jgi:hypothetical protein